MQVIVNFNYNEHIHLQLGKNSNLINYDYLIN